MHSLWNIINTIFLGDIYHNKIGIISGINIFLINGEGLAGLIISSIMSVFFLFNLKIINKGIL